MAEAFSARFLPLLDDVLELRRAAFDQEASITLRLHEEVHGDGLPQLRDALLLIGTMRLCPSTTDLEWVKTLRDNGIFPSVEKTPMRLDSSITIPFKTFGYGVLERLTLLFFSDEDRDENFEADCAILREQFGGELRCLPAVRLSFEFMPDELSLESTKQQEAYLRKAVRLITHVQTMTKVSRRKFPLRPRFELGDIRLCLSRCCLTYRVVRQVQALLAFDVRVKILILPIDTRQVTYNEWRHAWASLLFTVCGHLKAAIRLRHPIDCLMVSHYDKPQHLEEQYQALFSVLVHATSIKKVMFNNLSARDRVHSMWR